MTPIATEEKTELEASLTVLALYQAAAATQAYRDNWRRLPTILPHLESGPWVDRLVDIQTSSSERQHLLTYGNFKISLAEMHLRVLLAGVLAVGSTFLLAPTPRVIIRSMTLIPELGQLIWPNREEAISRLELAAFDLRRAEERNIELRKALLAAMSEYGGYLDHSLQLDALKGADGQKKKATTKTSGTVLPFVSKNGAKRGEDA